MRDAVPHLPDLSTVQNRHTRRAVALMEEGLTEKVSVRAIAAAVGISSRHLTRCFQVELNRSPCQALVYLRLRRACELIDKTALTLSQIASEAGFYDPAHFSRCFQREFGFPPKELRKRSAAQACIRAGEADCERPLAETLA
jgi:transcriptional regulator GlxA family with amidase domain